MRSIDISKANAPPKSAKVLADQECGYGNGLEDTTIPRRVVRRGGSRKNPEQQRMFTGKRFGDKTTCCERAKVTLGRGNRRHKVSLYRSC